MAMDYNEALNVLERHRNVLGGASPTPSAQDHHKALEEALTWALDELAEVAERNETALEGIMRAMDEAAANDNVDHNDEEGDDDVS